MQCVLHVLEVPVASSCHYGRQSPSIDDWQRLVVVVASSLWTQECVVFFDHWYLGKVTGLLLVKQVPIQLFNLHSISVFEDGLLHVLQSVQWPEWQRYLLLSHSKRVLAYVWGRDLQTWNWIIADLFHSADIGDTVKTTCWSSIGIASWVGWEERNIIAGSQSLDYFVGVTFCFIDWTRL